MRRDQADATPLLPRDATHRFWRGGQIPRLLPPSATSDARWLLLTRALRALGDGAVSILLVTYLQKIGFSALEVGAIVTGTLLGSAALTLAVGLAPHGLHPLRLLRAAAVLMFATGMGFAIARSFWCYSWSRWWGRSILPPAM